MNSSDWIACLGLPESALVNQRVPKKLLIESGAATAGDKRLIQDGIEDLQWLAALKPETVGVPIFRDGVREYLEIAVLSATLRPDAKAARIGELVHRAVPYPVFLLLRAGNICQVSLAHKRWAQNDAGKIVLDGEITVAAFDSRQPELEVIARFLAALPLSRQPRSTLNNLYQGWMDTLLALQAAGLSGRFVPSITREEAVERHRAMQEVQGLKAEMAGLRMAAEKEKQVARQVELNLKLKAHEAQLALALQRI
jgi:hypothetical protein